MEKYSTEIVLQKFRGELTMLGGRAGGGDSEEGAYGQSGGYSRGGGDYAGGGGGGFGGRAQQGSGPKESFAADLDDDIPF